VGLSLKGGSLKGGSLKGGLVARRVPGWHREHPVTTTDAQYLACPDFATPWWSSAANWVQRDRYGAACLPEVGLMTLPHDPVTEPQPGGSRRNAHCPAGGPILASSAALLAGAIVLVLAHKASVTFLVIFVSSIAILLLLIAESGHGLLARTMQRGLAKPRELRSPRAHLDLRRTAVRIRHARIIVRGFTPTRRHT